LEAILASAGATTLSGVRITRRISARAHGFAGRSGGPANASSIYSIAGVLSVMTKPSCTMAGMVLSGLMARKAGENCSRASMSR
jgi:hypothetical protein